MEQRENFFVLLELPFDPPENDLEVIQAAITRKQAEWSRLRNHPTKGLWAQKCISYLPEIRRVMLDDTLRRAEAQAAVEEFSAQKEKKITDIDRHIEILLGKGYIAPEEVTKLAEMHSIDESEVLERIRAKKHEKFKVIDQQISLRMAKGYITEEEIKKIAKRHHMSSDEVRKRVRCPIRKGNGKKEKQKIQEEEKVELPGLRQIDRSIENSIIENLKIVGKKSLYDFLGLPENADLTQLQDAASKKKKELAAVSRRDAIVTASNILAGHCMTIFKADESRIAYDVSLAKARLAQLDSDIDVAGISGRIRPEYFRILVEKAMEFGMDKEEAERYIRDYCKRKKWSIELPREKKRIYLAAGIGAGIITVLLIVAGITFYMMQVEKQRRQTYEEILAQVEAQPDIQRKIYLLKLFTQDHQNDSDYKTFVEDAKNRITLLSEQLEEESYQNAIKPIDKMLAQGNLEEALKKGQEYIASSPPPAYARMMKKKIDEIKKKIDERDFQRVKSVLETGMPDEKIEALKNYLEAHPDGAHTAEARKAITDLSTEFFIWVKNAVKDAENAGDWEKCLSLIKTYTGLYDNSHADLLEEQIPIYQEKIREKNLFASLKKQAESFGDNYAKAIGIYKDYLEAEPDSPLRSKIEKEINRLEKLATEKKLKEKIIQLVQKLSLSKGRFLPKASGVFIDSRTGLMWTLLDSADKNPEKCLTYDEAKQQVKLLEDGGYTDWRLPSPKELSDLFSAPNPFPASPDIWYWSNESYSSYSDGWHEIVKTVGPKSQARHESYECGALRAVRKP